MKYFMTLKQPSVLKQYETVLGLIFNHLLEYKYFIFASSTEI